MQTKKALIISAVTGLIGMGFAALHAQQAEQPSYPSEKCYGVAKAGKNDCAAAGHACQAHATRDGDAREWIYLPAGTCERIVGGSLTSSSSRSR